MTPILPRIEANPLRAKLVAGLEDYPWSSYQARGLAVPESLLSTFPKWESLGKTEAIRLARWRRKLKGPQNGQELAAVRESVRTGRLFGTTDWSEAIARRLGVKWPPRPRGRPRKDGSDATK